MYILYYFFIKYETANDQEKQIVITGERFGLIRFGSRVDVYLPKGLPALVTTGQHCIAGETVIADFKSQELPRIGEIR